MTDMYVYWFEITQFIHSLALHLRCRVVFEAIANLPASANLCVCVCVLSLIHI